ncbi:hypothetical protein GQ602_002573 [Ophiocordyceps camponoti-floridani]|uniref:Uncharacterized protein n=1 Tax=Ophiocordyceps camponoti-floridani TaxID=2030778 RepID=A0A8H4VFR8_9HYPO|nr:hypothetical protein GQ602_002573 [Ophiocordyceps camponoti-floridani]
MDRRASARRRPLPGSISPQSTTPEEGLQSPASPEVPAVSTPTRRGTKLLNFSLTNPNRPQAGTKRRSRTMDGSEDFDQDGSPVKGGHSLRKRTRVSYYNMEHNVDDTDDDPVGPSSARAKKRKSDLMEPSDNFHSHPSKKRGNSLGADAVATRRNPVRKNADSKSYHEDEDDVKDTIEVGISFSDDELESRPLGSSSSSKISAPEGHAPADGTASSNAQQKVSDTALDARKLPEPAVNGDLPCVLFQGRSVDSSQQELQPAATSFTETVVNTPREAFQDPSFSSWSDLPSTADEPRSSPRPTQESMDAAESIDQRDQVHGPNARPEGDASALISATEAPKPDETETPEAIAAKMQQISPGETQTSEAMERLQPEVVEIEKPEPAETRQTEVAETRTTETQQNDAIETQQTVAVASETQQTNITENQPIKAAEAQEEGAQAQIVDDQPMEATEAEKAEKAEIADVEQSQAMEEQQPTSTGVAQPEPAVAGHELPHTDPSPEKDVDNQQSDSETPQCEEIQTNAENAQQPAIAAPSSDTAAQEATDSAADTDRALAKEDLSRGQSTDSRWAHLNPYIDNEFQLYPLPEPKKKGRGDGGEGPLHRTGTSAGKDGNEDTTEAQASDSTEPTATNSPAPAATEESGSAADTQDLAEKPIQFKCRKLQDPAVYAAALENHKEMSTEELYEVLNVVRAALLEWQTEYQDQAKLVQDHDNAKRRLEVDTKYESKTRDLSLAGAHHEEPDFVVKKHGRKTKGDKDGKDSKDKDRDKEAESDLRWLQSQDRIMASSYYFAYDPHPSRIGNQDMENRDVEGAFGTQRLLRGQPKQTLKASEAGKEEVKGKRTRKPVQHFDPAPKQASRSGTPVPMKPGRKRQTATATAAAATALIKTPAIETRQKAVTGKKRAASPVEDADEPQKGPKRRRVHTRAKGAEVDEAEEDSTTPPTTDAPTARRGKKASKSIKTETEQAGNVDGQPKRHVLTLKIPKSKNASDPSTAETESGNSRPSTASSDSSSHTAESSYSFRPKRQKRFRDEPDDNDVVDKPPPKKRNKRIQAAADSAPAGEAPANRKGPKIKVVSKSNANRNGAPAPTEGEDRPPKDYKSMTKSEKMSASMKSRWANGNMAGAVEKRKATLAAKKAALAASAQQKAAESAPKIAKARTSKTTGQKQQSDEQQQPDDAEEGPGSPSPAGHDPN